MDRGDIWVVNLESSVGHEQKGFRPVLIVSPAAFNKLTNVPVVLPITKGGSFARRRGFAVSLENAGTQTTGIIRCDQSRALDIVARKGQHVKSVPRIILDDVLARLATILE
ncbi:MAG: type II toxin-antitoxin system PemK/MazF family toxin [Gammaproteobacteria bacterium]|nr:type II toxin-antitoxin system PemK/MazF family toxin [Gammaproteobacteria bacterium]